MATQAKRRSVAPTGFGATLRRIRESSRMTQAELGALCEMAYQAIARIERGENEPTWPTVLKLARALGVTPNAFVTESA